MRRFLCSFLFLMAFAAGIMAQTPQQNTGQGADDKAKAAATEVGDKAEDVKDQTAKGAKAVGRGTKQVATEAADKVEDAGGKAKSAGREIGDKAEDAKDQAA